MRDEKGRFLPGKDPSRHKFTPEERKRGGQEAFRRVVFEVLPCRYGDGRAVNFMRWVKNK